MKAIDLFAGAGGFTTGAEMAGCTVVWAANHWQSAVEIHAANHPHALHVCQDLQQADWTQVPAHDMMLASPACQGHSKARGKEKAHHDAQRATAWAVVSAAECHRQEVVIVENVVEFATRWILYPAWCAAMTALGYAISPMVVDSADHGVPQHRRRIYIVCTRSKHPIELTLPKREHVPASSFIDFSAGNWSKIEKPGRADRTLERIAAGRKVHGDRFLVAYYGNERGGRSLNRPVGTLTTKDRYAVVDGDRMRMLTVEESRKGMGFPDDYILPSNSEDAVKMIGNAVTPQVPCDIITALKEAA